MAEAATTGAVGITAVEDSTGAVDLTAAAGVGLQVADLPAIGAASQAGAQRHADSLVAEREADLHEAAEVAFAATPAEDSTAAALAVSTEVAEATAPEATAAGIAN